VVSKDRKAFRVSKAFRVRLDLKVRKVTKAFRVFRVSKARQAHKGHKVNPEKSLPMAHSL
jgi:hypothetical protein